MKMITFGGLIKLFGVLALIGIIKLLITKFKG
jgi:hypothetical protein